MDAQLHGKDIRTHELLIAGRITVGRLSHGRRSTPTWGLASQQRSLSSVHLADGCAINDQFIRRAIRKVVQLKGEFDDKDDFRIGDDLHIAFLYAIGSGVSVDKGVTYGAEDALSDDGFIEGDLLELKTDNVQELWRKSAAFGLNPA